MVDVPDPEGFETDRKQAKPDLASAKLGDSSFYRVYTIIGSAIRLADALGGRDR